MVSDGNYLLGLWTENQKYYLGTIEEKKLIYKKDLKVFRQTEKWLDDYFLGRNPSIQNIPLKMDGSNFRKIVWKILCEIPYGEVRTYKDIANEVAKIMKKEKMSAQAVGGAIAHNPISIIVPCHRVIGTNGDLTGYAGGIELKEWLLKHEKVK